MFGEFVRRYRQRLGLTQQELADMAGLGVRSIRKIEAGRVHTPRPPTVRLLADTFQLSGAERDEFCVAAAQGTTVHAEQLHHNLRAYVAAAADEMDPGRRFALLKGVLDQYSGDLLADVAPAGLRLNVVAEVRDWQLTAVELAAEAELGLGNAEAAIALAAPRALQVPVRERMVAVLMGAYWAVGRKSEAISSYHAARRILVDELGVEPGPRMRVLYDEILRDEASDQPPVAVGDQLPAIVEPFVGREREMSVLDQIQASGSGRHITVISGGGGMGKTALAAHWARRHAADFSDGMVYVDMGGFSPTPTMSAADAMTQVLMTLGVNGPDIPTDLRTLQPLYHRTAGHLRMLVIFDDVIDDNQVRPALLANPHGTVLITSRRRLSPLVVRGEADLLELPPLADDESLALMMHLLPHHRHDITELRSLASSCAHVPLFLRVGAANVRPGVDPAAVVAALHAGQVLDLLQDASDPLLGARGTLSLSCGSLPDAALHLLRVLGRAPLAFVTPDSAAAMLAIGPVQARWLLDRIADVHLIEQVSFHVYRLHDLVRSFAAEQSQPAGPEVDRLLRFYVQAVVHAATTATAKPDLEPVEYDPELPLPALDSPHTAVTWLDNELPNIVAVVRYAADGDPHDAAWKISQRLTNYFWIRRSMPEWRMINEAALTAARRADQPAATASILNALAVMIWTTNDLAHAQQLFEEALAINNQLGRAVGQASNHTNLGSLCRQSGRLADADAHTQAAIRLGRRHHRPLTVANALLTASLLHRDQGHLYHASRTVRQALDGYRELQSTDGQVSCLNELASIHIELGHVRTAEAAAGQALHMADTFGSVPGAVFARDAMAELLAATGRAEQALTLSQAAVDRALDVGERRIIIPAMLRQAATLAAAGHDAHARRQADAAHALAADQRDLHGQIDALLLLASLPGSPGETLALTRTAETKASCSGLLLRAAKAQQIRAEACTVIGDATGARSAARQAWPTLRRSGAKAWILRCGAVLRAAEST